MGEQIICETPLPTHNGVLTPNQEECLCILSVHRDSPHRCRLPNGELITWYYRCADEADGDECTDPVDCLDFESYPVSEGGT